MELRITLKYLHGENGEEQDHQEHQEMFLKEKKRTLGKNDDPNTS